jgi:hypothetical protein
MADDEEGGRFRLQEPFEPENAFEVEMVGGLVHQENRMHQGPAMARRTPPLTGRRWVPRGGEAATTERAANAGIA